MQDDDKAAEWYRLRGRARRPRGDVRARHDAHVGRAGGVDREEAAKLLAAAAKLDHPLAAYNLGLLYLEGQLFPQDFARAAELFRVAADAGSPEAQYALATLYKEGRGVSKDVGEAGRLYAARRRCRQHRRAGRDCDRPVQRRRRGQGRAGRRPLPASARPRKGSPIAQNRLAHILAAGRGLPADPVEAIKWHLISKAGGASDQNLDAFMRKQKPETVARRARRRRSPPSRRSGIAREQRS